MISETERKVGRSSRRRSKGLENGEELWRHSLIDGVYQKYPGIVRVLSSFLYKSGKHSDQNQRIWLRTDLKSRLLSVLLEIVEGFLLNRLKDLLCLSGTCDRSGFFTNVDYSSQLLYDWGKVTSLWRARRKKMSIRVVMRTVFLVART